MSTLLRELRGTFSRSRQNEEGFTLVELLVVLVIIALIATLAGPQVLRYLGSSRTNAATAQIRNIQTALELYYVDNARYPSKEDGLPALIAAPAASDRWNGPYLRGDNSINDPWGRQYLYDYADNGATVVVTSLGRDGKVGGTGEDQDIGGK